LDAAVSGYPQLQPVEPGWCERSCCAFRPTAARRSRAIEPEERSLERLANLSLVVRVVHDLDASSEEDHDALLCDLLLTTWGSIEAQNQ
jgi:hypothetical protein